MFEHECFVYANINFNEFVRGDAHNIPESIKIYLPSSVSDAGIRFKFLTKWRQVKGTVLDNESRFNYD